MELWEIKEAVATGNTEILQGKESAEFLWLLRIAQEEVDFEVSFLENAIRNAGHTNTTLGVVIELGKNNATTKE